MKLIERIRNLAKRRGFRTDREIATQNAKLVSEYFRNDTPLSRYFSSIRNINESEESADNRAKLRAAQESNWRSRMNRASDDIQPTKPTHKMNKVLTVSSLETSRHNPIDIKIEECQETDIEKTVGVIDEIERFREKSMSSRNREFV